MDEREIPTDPPPLERGVAHDLFLIGATAVAHEVVPYAIDKVKDAFTPDPPEPPSSVVLPPGVQVDDE